MLLPRFTIRTLLAILTVCALVFVMVGTAYRGQYWAWGVTIALISLIITALAHAAWFGIVWLFGQVLSQRTALSTATLHRLEAARGVRHSADRTDGQVAVEPPSEH